jgi:YaiO family outer membrane protein
MRYIFLISVFFFSLSTIPSPAEAEARKDIPAMLREAAGYASAERYDDALNILKEAHDADPENVEIDLARIRILSWKGDYASAQAALDRIYEPNKDNADVQLMQGYLFYYQGRNDEAIKLFNQILSRYPDYADARDGLSLARNKTESPEYRWQIDAGYEYSSFSRRPQPAWNQKFLQINHFLNNRKTALHGRITSYDQFKNIDSEYEAGIDHNFLPWLTAYLYSAFSPEADFRPDWRLAAGGAIRLNRPRQDLPVIWMTLDTRRDLYDDTDVLSINPGLRIEPMDGWAISAKAISVDQKDAKRVYGHEFRLDGQMKEGLRFTLGFADAPETVAGVTVDTKTYFGGIAADIGEAHTVRLNYAHDDRDNSWKRDVINVSISYRF